MAKPVTMFMMELVDEDDHDDDDDAAHDVHTFTMVKGAMETVPSLNLVSVTLSDSPLATGLDYVEALTPS